MKFPWNFFNFHIFQKIPSGISVEFPLNFRIFSVEFPQNLRKIKKKIRDFQLEFLRKIRKFKKILRKFQEISRNFQLKFPGSAFLKSFHLGIFYWNSEIPVGNLWKLNGKSGTSAENYAIAVENLSNSNGKFV